MGLPEKYRPCGHAIEGHDGPKVRAFNFTPVEPPVDPILGEIDATDGAATIVGPTADPGIDDEPQAFLSLLRDQEKDDRSPYSH